MEPKTAQGSSKGTPAEKYRKSDEKGGPRQDVLGAFSDINLFKMHSQIHLKINLEKVWTIMPTGSQNGTKIDSTTHYKSMQQMTSKKER